MDDQEAIRFDDIYQMECDEIHQRRTRHSYYLSSDEQSKSRCPPENLVGLALSGGGIRSATFCLGVLQGLHRIGLLRIFDYLSTVSGGGYVGGWWSAWLSRERMISPVDDDQALLKEEDIKHPRALIAKLRSSKEPIANELRKRVLKEAPTLLDSEPNSSPNLDDLRKALTTTLNKAIEDCFLYTPLWCDIERDDDVDGYQRLADLKPERYPLLTTRLLLEEAFPYELRDIFPPREKSETERPRPVYVSSGENKAETYSDSTTDPIHHLRLYANYLTPRRGILSADTWRAVSVILRNLVFTWLILLPGLTAIMLLGQLYFLLLPATRQDFLREAIDNKLYLTNTDILAAVGWPLAAILGWIVVMAVAWLICNRDQASPSDWIVQVICLVAVSALILTGVHVHEPLWPLIRRVFSQKTVIWKIAVWAIVPVVSIVYVLKKASGKDAPNGDAATIARWKQEVRRNKIGTIQASLFVLFASLAVVLTLSGFSHRVAGFLFNSDFNLSSKLIWQIFGIVPVISAIAGIIFTALKASPAGGSDKRASREPTAITRLVFAVTPVLVVVVLAVLVSWLSFKLLGHLSRITASSESVFQGTSHPVLPPTQSLLMIGGLYGISLCMALAMYEMKWKVLTPSREFYAFLLLLIINLSWGAVAMFRFIVNVGTNDPSSGLLLLGFSIFFVFLVGVFIFNRVASNGTWNQFLLANEEDGILSKETRERHPRVWRLAVFVVLLLMGGAGTGLSWISIPGPTSPWKLHTSSVPFGFAALGGSIILFRIATRRRGGGNGIKFDMRLFRNNTFFKKSESIWILVSGCVALPLAIVCWIHALMAPSNEIHSTRDLVGLITYPIAIALLLIGLVLFRSLVANAYSENNRNTNVRQRSKLEKILAKVFASTDDLQNRRRNTLRGFVAGSVIVAIASGHLAVKLSAAQAVSFQQLHVGVSWRALSVFLIFGITLLILRTAVVHLSLHDEDTTVSVKTRKKGKRVLQNQGFNWTVAVFCIGIAILIGFLNKLLLLHVKEYPNIVGPSSIVLPGMVACFNLMLFEIWWGDGENRRSLWLFLVAYLGLSLLFAVGILVPSEQWDLFMKPLITVLGLLAFAFVWIVAVGWMVDPNSMAMHQFYKSRLTRAYLGASNVRRHEEVREITEAVAGDDVPLDSLSNCRRGGPYHLINTTLNLVAGRDLATAQRSAASFVLSPRSCGSSRTNYRSTFDYMNGGLTLGTAVAASGAAVSPSMGSKKPTAALAMLMTLLNIRLGYWAPTPNRHNWKMTQPRLWPFYLMREFLSQTNDLSSYCYLTDGGHFDNTGLYSLVERGCRYIVLVDCGADPQPSCFEDLGEAIRRCRIDFGTEIELDIEPFIKDEDRSPSKYFVTGSISYSKEHAHTLGLDRHLKGGTPKDDSWREGTIVYFKPSIIGNETADVRQYAIENESFPHQTTANQWFDEAQFESYRCLGEHVANEAFGGLDTVKALGETLSIDDIKAIFTNIENKERMSRRTMPLFF